MTILKLLVKTYVNWCATLNSTSPRSKIRNIIDNDVDNDNVTKTTGQLAWARSGSQIIDPRGARTQTTFVYLLCKFANCNFAQLLLVEFKTSRTNLVKLKKSGTNQMFPAKHGIPAKVSCATSGLYYLCFKYTWQSMILITGTLNENRFLGCEA